jgi:hypothetical protein
MPRIERTFKLSETLPNDHHEKAPKREYHLLVSRTLKAELVKPLLSQLPSNKPVPENTDDSNAKGRERALFGCGAHRHSCEV